MTSVNPSFANSIAGAILANASPSLNLTLAAFSVMRFTAGLVQTAAQLNALQTFANLGRSPVLCSCSTAPVITPEASVEPWTATMPQNGRASVDLGDGYTMELNENSSQIIIKDADGNNTRIWGDPHVDVNGSRIGDFYDTTTFQLENGTKITINTEPWQYNPNAYVASQVVVTKGDQALVIDGISQNEKGDLAITMSENGRALDFAHDDGLNLYEQDLGGGDYGWVSEFTGERATRGDFDLTRHANREVREAMEFSRDMSTALGAWLFFGDLGGLVSFANSETAERGLRDDVERAVSPFLEALATS